MLFTYDEETLDLQIGSVFYLVSEPEMELMFNKIFSPIGTRDTRPVWLTHMRQFANMPFTIERIANINGIAGGIYLRSVEGYENIIGDECYIITPHFLTTEKPTDYDDVNSETSSSVSSLFQ